MKNISSIFASLRLPIACLKSSMMGIVFLGAGQAYAQTTQYTGWDHAISHSTQGCGGATVTTPQPGTEFKPVMNNMPSGVEAFYDQAARQHVTWHQNVTCRILPEVKFGLNSATNWAGYQLDTTSQYVQSGWHVPTVQAPPVAYSSWDPSFSYTGYFSGNWVGIGGVNGSFPFIQAGTGQYYDVPGYPLSYYFSFYEIFLSANDPNSNAVIISTVDNGTYTINPGDWVGSDVYWVPSANMAVFGFCDWTTNECVNFNVPNIPQPGNTTEWVGMEALTYGQAPLAYTSSTVDMRGACWATATTLTTSTNTNTLYPVGTEAGANGVTGSVSDCQSIPSTAQMLSISQTNNTSASSSGITVTATPGPLGAVAPDPASYGTGFNITTSYSY